MKLLKKLTIIRTILLSIMIATAAAMIVWADMFTKNVLSVEYWFSLEGITLAVTLADLYVFNFIGSLRKEIKCQQHIKTTHNKKSTPANNKHKTIANNMAQEG